MKSRLRFAEGREITGRSMRDGEGDRTPQRESDDKSDGYESNPSLSLGRRGRSGRGDVADGPTFYVVNLFQRIRMAISIGFPKGISVPSAQGHSGGCV